MKSVLPAPTGHHAIAQGNALGIWSHTFPSPERATCFYGTMDGSACNIPPRQDGISYGPCPQGVALDYRRAPLWGFERLSVPRLNRLAATLMIRHRFLL